MSVKAIAEHDYTDRQGRNLCDRCNRWQGDKSHRQPALTEAALRTAQAAIDAETQTLIDSWGESEIEAKGMSTKQYNAWVDRMHQREAEPPATARAVARLTLLRSTMRGIAYDESVDTIAAARSVAVTAVNQDEDMARAALSAEPPATAKYDYNGPHPFESADLGNPTYGFCVCSRKRTNAIHSVEPPATALDDPVYRAWKQGYYEGREDDEWRTQAEIEERAAAYATPDDHED